MKVLHPLADEWADDYLLLTTSSERVVLTAAIRGFLIEARSSQCTPVLLTSSTAHLAWTVMDELRVSGGCWAVQDDQGRVFDGGTGRRIRSFRELWSPQPNSDPGLPAYDGVCSSGPGAFLFDVFTREEAAIETRAGGVAEHMVAELGGGRLVRWDTCEPLARPWSRDDLTEHLRLQMPATEHHFARSDMDVPVSITMARTRHGLLEHTRGIVPVGTYGRPTGLSARAPVGSHPALTSALLGLAERFRVNVALITYCQVTERDGSLGQLPERRHMDAPAALLIGPIAARTLKLDVRELEQRHDVELAGPRKIPSVLVRFSGPDDLWFQAINFCRDLDQERLAGLLGMSASSGKE
ncbi:hypothetical protein EII34_05370 [Arachnia propionica]|uniref:Uncharacterized protein n=1 Tax=Arachnia propionica TaxID=1750 RepID=A0A3P1T9K0_9ACTN|nr:DUF6177 family protein [Arachnia propionica]RRD06114.1 hypothetical protein EII34_05370 [Arachnia propionica]